MKERFNGIDINYYYDTNNSETLVCLLHGLTMSASMYPLDRFASDYFKLGYDVLRFDFIGHGDTISNTLDMTIKEEINEAMHMILKFKDKYKKLILVGHSQGGVVASYIAKDLNPDILILLAPAFNLKDMIQNGNFFGKKIKENKPIHIWNMHLSYEYLMDALTEEYYKIYVNKVFWIHGENDILVPNKTVQMFKNVQKSINFTTIFGSDHEFIGHYDELWHVMKTLSY